MARIKNLQIGHASVLPALVMFKVVFAQLIVRLTLASGWLEFQSSIFVCRR